MDLFGALKRKSKPFYAFFILLSMIKSASTIGILMFINYKISGRPVPYANGYDWQAFAGLIAISFLASKLFQQSIIRMTANVYTDFEIAIFRKLRHCTFSSFEKIGNERIFTALGDIRTMGNIPMAFMNIFHAVIIVGCCLGYLFSVSWIAGLIVLGVMLVLLFFYLIRNSYIMKRLNKLRDMQNEYYKLVHDLLLGFKELKMNTVRNSNFFVDHLEVNCNQRRSLTIDTSISYLNNELVGSYSWYVVLGVIMFGLPSLALGMSWNLTSIFAIIIFYMMGPVSVLITVFPTLSNVRIASQRLSQFNQLMDESLVEESDSLLENNSNIAGKRLKQLSITDVTFSHLNSRNEVEFKFGPVCVDFRPGEIVFITGGNGSGKSTFVSLLTGLYKPMTGTLSFNDTMVTEQNYPQYRDRIAVVFSNNYLFRNNYDRFDFHPNNRLYHDLLATMQLDEVVEGKEKTGNMVNGLRLSKGQQKRLALIYALMEKRDILILDEWAAEQDPAFREYFYREMLMGLKKEGKTVIAVTHDDHYYSYADRIIRFAYGKVAEEAKSEITEKV